jgi:hypothetical protein
MKRQLVAMRAMEAILSTFISADRMGHIGKVLRNLIKLSTNTEERYSHCGTIIDVLEQ